MTPDAIGSQDSVPPSPNNRGHNFLSSSSRILRTPSPGINPITGSLQSTKVTILAGPLAHVWRHPRSSLSLGGWFQTLHRSLAVFQQMLPKGPLPSANDFRGAARSADRLGSRAHGFQVSPRGAPTFHKHKSTSILSVQCPCSSNPLHHQPVAYPQFYTCSSEAQSVKITSQGSLQTLRNVMNTRTSDA